MQVGGEVLSMLLEVAQLTTPEDATVPGLRYEAVQGGRMERTGTIIVHNLLPEMLFREYECLLVRESHSSPTCCAGMFGGCIMGVLFWQPVVIAAVLFVHHQSEYAH